MGDPSTLLDSLAAALHAEGIDASGWLRAWARLLPSLLLVPALGPPLLPLGLRVVFAAVLGAVIAPTLAPEVGAAPLSGPSWAALAGELGRGLPPAAGVAVGLWGAAMTGHLLDELTGSAAAASAPLDEATPSGPLGVLLALLAAVAFFELGGPSRLLAAVASAPPLGAADVRSLALALARGIQLAVALAGPLLAVAPVAELLSGLVSRAAFPGARGALGSLRGVVLFVGAALLLDRLAAGVVLWLDRALTVG